ncbi:MAG: DUF1338 domain-containing protein [Phycisphaeraceae bacterium]
MSDVHPLLEKLWNDYAKLNPSAKAIQELLTATGERIVNDHIALRTFRDPKVGIDALARAFLEGGYEAKGEYEFTEKKLYARHYEHADVELPKVFISELKLDECSPALKAKVEELIAEVPEETAKKDDFAVAGRPWKVTWPEYEALAAESEYASWVAAFGFRANHFTIFVNALDTFDSLELLSGFLKDNGYKLNTSGGEIKGTPEVFLEQSSTLADQVEVKFDDGSKHVIPACYYEFAKRYPMPDGKLYQGFVAKSADKIFESTNRK